MTRPTDTPFLAILAVFLQLYVIGWQAKLSERKVGARNSDARNATPAGAPAVPPFGPSALGECVPSGENLY